MPLIHESMNRGRSRTGWLDAFHSFSFGSFRDPTRMGFGRLRVLNEDHIVPGAGFPVHDHAGMDILTYVLSGHLRHQDNLGHTAEIAAGEVQLMSAGTGITHAEMNASQTDRAHLLQIWLIPDDPGGAPTYHQHALPADAGRHGLTRIAGGPPGPGILPLRSDTTVWLARPAMGETTSLPLEPGRLGFVHLVSGLATAEDEALRGGDALQTDGGPLPDLLWQTEGEALYFDMPAH